MYQTITSALSPISNTLLYHVAPEVIAKVINRTIEYFTAPTQPRTGTAATSVNRNPLNARSLSSVSQILSCVTAPTQAFNPSILLPNSFALFKRLSNSRDITHYLIKNWVLLKDIANLLSLNNPNLLKILATI